MALLRKFTETLRFLRFGPTRLDAVTARADELEHQLGRAKQRSRELDEHLRGVQAELTEHQAQTAAQLAELRQQAAAANQVAAAANQAAAAAAADFQREAAWTRNQVSALGATLDRLHRAQGSPAVAPAGAVAAEEAFYPTLEHHFRGSAQDLRQRLGAYRQWMQGLPPGPVADLGCGRGEWLELLGEWGLASIGVDLNAPNVEGMRQRGLEVHHADALEWLQSQPADSLAAITTFHVIEHLPFGVLLRLVQEARRALRPGGRLIMETPNPENVIVATQTFWLDPSHVRPLPPALLEVVVRDAGLELEALLRLNPPEADGHDIADPTLRSLMTQGRDCAVVARKATVGAA